MALYDSLLPSSRPFSYNCTLFGADTVIHPETGPPGADGNCATSDAVPPASTFTVCVIGPVSPSSTTACSPTARSPTTSGDVARGTPSMLTRAPARSVRLGTLP